MGKRLIKKRIPAKEQIQKHIRLDPDLFKDLEAICEHNNRTFDDVVSTFLEWAVENELAEIERDTASESKND